MIRQAFVLGAGLGKRLLPLTDDLPKPLVPIFGKPLVTFALDHLLDGGVKSFVVNTHRLPERFAELLGNSYRGRPLRLIHEPVLLETGGGIKNAEPFLEGENFFVYSGDILSDLPLGPLVEEHFRAGNDVTLAVRSTGVATDVALQDRRVVDIGNRRGHSGNYDYANISVWSRRAFSRFAAGKKVSFIPVLVDWIGDGGRIGGVVIEEGRWFNLTSPNEYLRVHGEILAQHWRPAYLNPPEWPVQVAPEATVEPGAQAIGYSSIGPGCRVGAGAVIEDSILWPGAEIAPCSRLKRCIVRTRRPAAGTLADAIV